MTNGMGIIIGLRGNSKQRWKQDRKLLRQNHGAIIKRFSLSGSEDANSTRAQV